MLFLILLLTSDLNLKQFKIFPAGKHWIKLSI